ncbi:MAG: hypothetical protein K5855_00415 [Oscillospiraceae bacterium]|nr:hypothetical protein [Oscillospiraceae bacterium]
MSDLLKLAYDLIAKVVYNVVSWLLGFVKGFIQVFITGWADYSTIFKMYFPYFTFPIKILAILLALILIAIPVLCIVIIIRRIVLHVQLKAVDEDNTVLYKEIGRLNRQVLDLMDEKAKILNMKVSTVNGGPVIVEGSENTVSDMSSGYGTPVGIQNLGTGIIDPLADPTAMGGGAVMGSGGAMMGGGVGVVGGGIGEASIGEDALSAATAAAVSAVTAAKQQSEEMERNTVDRFPKLSVVDAKYADYERPEFDDTVDLEHFTENFRLFAASQMKLYYTPEILRRFVAGMASSKLLILEGISGTGKTSLPYSFSRYLNNPATIISVQPSYRDRTELIGYFNEFSKRFNETEFLRALYEANYREDPSLVVLDEMNLARIEYYFAEMLSVLELPDKNEWLLDLVPTAWPGDPVKLVSGKIRVPPTIWFVGTANNDDSTFTITDKVYDRAIPIEINERAEAFECELQPRCCVTCAHLEEMFAKAKEDHPITDSTLAKMLKLDSYLQTRFKLAFGNRIMKQMYDFIPVYVACGGTEIDGLDYIVARKVLKKFESMNVSFVRDEIKGLLQYMEKTFGKSNMQDSRSYLERIQNLY